MRRLGMVTRSVHVRDVTRAVPVRDGHAERVDAGSPRGAAWATPSMAVRRTSDACDQGIRYVGYMGGWGVLGHTDAEHQYPAAVEPCAEALVGATGCVGGDCYTFSREVGRCRCQVSSTGNRW